MSNNQPSETPKTEDEQLAEAMRLLEQSSVPDEPPEPDESHESAEAAFEVPQGPTSPTLDALDESRRPRPNTICETCPNSVWFSSPKEVKCYCRVMFLVTWSTKEPNVITGCDGIFLGQEED